MKCYTERRVVEDLISWIAVKLDPGPESEAVLQPLDLSDEVPHRAVEYMDLPFDDGGVMRLLDELLLSCGETEQT